MRCMVAPYIPSVLHLLLLLLAACLIVMLCFCHIVKKYGKRRCSMLDAFMLSACVRALVILVGVSKLNRHLLHRNSDPRF